MRAAGSFCYTRNRLDVKPLLSHGGLECIAAVIDSHMRHQGTPLRGCAAGLLVCLFVCKMPRRHGAVPLAVRNVMGPVSYRVMVFRFAAGVLQLALTLLSPMVSSAASATSRDMIVAAER